MTMTRPFSPFGLHSPIPTMYDEEEAERALECPDCPSPKRPPNDGPMWTGRLSEVRRPFQLNPRTSLHLNQPYQSFVTMGKFTNKPAAAPGQPSNKPAATSSQPFNGRVQLWKTCELPMSSKWTEL